MNAWTPQQNPATDPIYGYLLADSAFTAAVKKQDVPQAASAAAKIVKVGDTGCLYNTPRLLFVDHTGRTVLACYLARHLRLSTCGYTQFVTWQELPRCTA